MSVAAVELAFPTKPDLLKATIDVAIAGDDEPVPVLERPWAESARAAPDATAFLDTVATILVPAAERSDERWCSPPSKAHAAMTAWSHSPSSYVPNAP